jgi:hypothetical protein
MGGRALLQASDPVINFSILAFLPAFIFYLFWGKICDVLYGLWFCTTRALRGFGSSTARKSTKVLLFYGCACFVW